jgi:CO dehydrogenase flavoprotein C-terminal domain
VGGDRLSGRPPIEFKAGAELRFDRDRIHRRPDHPPLADEPRNPTLIDAGPAVGQRKQFSLAPTVGQRFLGPPVCDEAVAAGASDPLLLGWAGDRDGDETRIDVEGRVDDGEAVSRRAHPGEVARLGGRIGEGERAVGIELGAEPYDGELRHEPFGSLDRGACLLADLDLRRQYALGQLVAGTAAEARGASGSREIPLVAFHRLPDDTPQVDTVLEPGELIIALTLSPNGIASRSSYRKVRDRASYAFALVSVAAGVEMEGGMIKDVRIALGGVAHKPWRAERAEAALRGGPATEAAFRKAAEAELVAAEGLSHNGFKIELATRVIADTLGKLANVQGAAQ